MKWLLRVLAAIFCLLAGAALILYIMGKRPDAGKAYCMIEIAAPAERIWPYLKEGDKLKLWVSWMVEVQQPAPDKQTWLMADMNNGGQLMSIYATIAESFPPHRLKLSTQVPGVFSGIHSYTLTDLGNHHTRMELHNEFRITNWFANLMLPLIMREANKKRDADLAKLKSLVEADK